MASEARDGPYVSVAVICEKVIEDKAGVLSAIQMIDRVTINAPPGAPAEMPSIPVKVTVLISLKSGAARGRRTLTLRPETPAGTAMPDLAMPVLFEGEERAATVVVDVPFQAEIEGLYWFDVLLDEKRVTRIPLRILYRRVVQGMRPTAS